MFCLFTSCGENIISQHGSHAVTHTRTTVSAHTRLQRSNIPQNNKALHSLCCALPKLYFETKNYSAGKRLTEIKARVIRVSYLKMGGVVTDTNCHTRASQSLYQTIADSLFGRLPPRALLAASPLARDSCSDTFSPWIFEQKRDCSRLPIGGPAFGWRIKPRDCGEITYFFPLGG